MSAILAFDRRGHPDQGRDRRARVGPGGAGGARPTPTPWSGPALERLAALGAELRADRPIAGVGLCVAGLVGDDGRVVALPGKLDGIVGLDLPAWLEDRFGVPARVRNDAVAYGIGEATRGGGGRPRARRGGDDRDRDRGLRRPGRGADLHRAPGGRASRRSDPDPRRSRGPDRHEREAGHDRGPGARPGASSTAPSRRGDRSRPSPRSTPPRRRAIRPRAPDSTPTAAISPAGSSPSPTPTPRGSWSSAGDRSAPTTR